MSRSRNFRSVLAKAALALALAGLLGGIAAPAQADDRDRDRHRPPPRHRPHPQPAYIVPAPIYAPPAVVYAPPAPSLGINLIFPFNFR
ncbi:MAG: hypothetical protein ACLQJR_14615 [Stellaceae bacterium]